MNFKFFLILTWSMKKFIHTQPIWVESGNKKLKQWKVLNPISSLGISPFFQWLVGLGNVLRSISFGVEAKKTWGAFLPFVSSKPLFSGVLSPSSFFLSFFFVHGVVSSVVEWRMISGLQGEVNKSVIDGSEHVRSTRALFEKTLFERAFKIPGMTNTH